MTEPERDNEATRDPEYGESEPLGPVQELSPPELNQGDRPDLPEQ
jgi:hypothetical protein